MPALMHLALGVLATCFAAARLWSWTAIGLSLGADRVTLGSAGRTAIALLIGSAVTILVYAPLAAAGLLGAAVAVDGALALGFSMANRRRSRDVVTSTLRLLLPESGIARIGLTVFGLMLWIVAIGPPRDGDVMYYHLAHIRQIIAEGAWRPLPICSYGIPFGWSLTYLPFEWVGLPQTAHLVNGGAWLTAGSVCVEAAADWAPAARREVTARMTRAMLVGATLMPQILKSATTAMADAFMILVVATTLALLLRWPRVDRAGAMALGFVALIAMHTRYQAAAVALAVAAIVLVDVARRRVPRTVLGPLGVGAAIGAAVAVPFYLANAIAFGSPVWPLASSLHLFSRLGQYPDAAQLAANCTARAMGGGAATAAAAAAYLLFDPSVFPIPLLVAVGVLAALVGVEGVPRRVAFFGCAFVGVWVLAQPALEPRFSIYLLPVALLCVAPVAAALSIRPRAAEVIRVIGAVALVLLGVVAGVYSSDYLRLAVTGDLARFHFATWYWPAYDWANRRTPRDAHFVAMVYGSQTYPLHRWNLPADPGSSAIVPWRAIDGVCGFAPFLRSERIDYVIYEPRSWVMRPGDAQMERAVREAVDVGAFVVAREFDVPIVSSRILRTQGTAHLVIYRVAAPRLDASCRAE